MASIDDFISDQELLSLSTGESLSNKQDKSDSDISLTVNYPLVMEQFCEYISYFGSYLLYNA